MSGPGNSRAIRRGGPSLALAMGFAAGLTMTTSATAGQLPLTHFTSENGLAGDSVYGAVQDHLGFIWFGTGAGLSRFDGRGFRNFGADGPEPIPIESLVEEEEGRLVVGAPDAAYLFDPAKGGTFERILSLPGGTAIVRVARGSDGRIWAGADGVYRLEREKGRPRFRRVEHAPVSEGEVAYSLAVDRRGNLWIGARGLSVISPEGRALRAITPAGFSLAVALAADEGGGIWAAFGQGICRVEEGGEGPPGIVPVCRPVNVGKLGYLGGWRLIPRAGSGLWAGSQSGLHEIDPGGRIVRSLTRAEGLSKSWAYPLLTDRAGNVWIALVHDGVARLRLSGLTVYGPSEGFDSITVSSIRKSRSGALVVFGSDHVLHVYEHDRFHAVRPNLPDISYPGWGWHQFELEDREGDWWIPTDQGIYRFSAVRRPSDLARAPLKAIYTKREGLPGESIFRLFEDSRGDIWMSVLYPVASGRGERPTLCRWERSTGTFHAYGRGEGVTEKSAPTAFMEMPDGSIWIGFSEGEPVLRYREGRFEPLVLGGVSDSFLISAFFRDSKKRVWMATRGAGLCRVDHPEGLRPSCAWLAARDGLASDEVNGVAEDAQGRIYVGGSRGVDILEEDRPVRHLGRSDGLPRSYVSAVFGDSDGGIWFGTLNGLARLDPREESIVSPPPEVRIDGIRVAGMPRPLSAVGEKKIEGLILEPDERRLQIEFVGLSPDAGETLSFQHRLTTGDPWSPAAPERTLLLPNLSPGRYRLEVRGLDPAGRVSREPAVVAFQVLAPVWARPWFLGLVALTLVAGAFAAYRLRIAHLMALQRQRTRIAMDLHDEVGSGLGSIGVLADLATDPGLGAPQRAGLLDQIAATASDLGSSMGDIVWSLHRSGETLEALARHLAERGRRLFPEGGAVLEIRFPRSWPDTRLPLVTRYHLAMIGVEAMHNAAKHSGASKVVLELTPADGRWRLAVTDDGHGIGPAGVSEDSPGGEAGGSYGFPNMRRRAEESGAVLSVESRPGEGTTVAVLFDPAARPKTRFI